MGILYMPPAFFLFTRFLTPEERRGSESHRRGLAFPAGRANYIGFHGEQPQKKTFFL
jgi:hypothetical protein